MAIIVQILIGMKETRPEVSLLELERCSTSPEADRALRSIIFGHGIVMDSGNDKIDDTVHFPYNVVEITNAPSGSTGFVLKVVSWLLTKSCFSPLLLRRIANKNSVGRVRALASTKDYVRLLPVTHHPFHHASQEELELATNWWRENGNSDSDDDSNDSNDNNISPLLKAYERKLVQQHATSSTTAAATTSTSTGNYRTVLDYHRVYRSGAATPVQVMERWIKGATERLDHLKIFSAMRPDLIRLQARESDRRWKAGTPLSLWDGVPVAIKDCSSVKGLRLCDGSSVCSNGNINDGNTNTNGNHSDDNSVDDIPSEYLKRAGAIVVGLTVMTEGGVTPLGYNAHFDGPFNAFDPEYYSGGSSGGSAVAVSSGLVPMAVGWDGGGSIRIPAAMSGVVGLAPTFGRVPFGRIHGGTNGGNNGSTNVKAGPIGATILDVALGHLVLGQVDRQKSGGTGTRATNNNNHKSDLFYNNIFGEKYLPDPHLNGVWSDSDDNNIDSNSDSENKSRLPLHGTRLGVFWDHFQHTDPEVYQKSLEVVRYLRDDLGATIVNITVPYTREIHTAHSMKILSEFGKTWEGAFYKSNDNNDINNNGHKLEPNTEISVQLGRIFTADEVLAAETVRTFAVRYFRDYLFRRNNGNDNSNSSNNNKALDAILSPAMGTKIPRLPPGVRYSGESNVPLMSRVMRFVPIANFLGLPALTVPVGYETKSDGSNNGMPIGFQFMGNAWSEHTLLKLGALVEEGFFRKQGIERKRPPNENYFDILEPWLGGGDGDGE